MAPRQLRLEPIEADSTADKGAKRVRVDSTEESTTQVYKIPPARQPDARPGLHRALLPSADHTCQSSGSRHGIWYLQASTHSPTAAELAVDPGTVGFGFSGLSPMVD
eukprot:scaffold15035_cov119-Isochrysis_galbana.AAC.6